MKRLEIDKIYKSPELYANATITVCGWVRTIRDSKEIGFMEINDGSRFKGLQVVFEAAKVSNYKDIAKLNVGAAVCVEGALLLTPGAGQPFEINAQTIAVEGVSSPEYPLQKKRHTLEYLRTISHLRPRTNTYSAAFKIRSAAAFAIHSFLIKTGSSMCTRPSYPQATVRVRGRCSK
jgi:asparaginyl-tRNA synthetase